MMMKNKKLLYGILTVVILTIFSIGLFFLSRPQQVPGPMEQITNLDKSIYQNSKHGFEIRFPDGWNINEAGRLGTIVVFTAPVPDEEEGKIFYANINILSRNLQSVGVKNLEEYVNLDKEMLLRFKEQATFLSDTSILIDEKYNGRIISLTFMQHGLLLRDKHLMVVRDGIVYVIAGTTLESEWLNYEELINLSLNSFSFRK